MSVIPRKVSRAITRSFYAGEIALGILLVVAFLFGGTSVLYPFQRTIVLLAALAMICWLVGSGTIQSMKRLPTAARVAIGGLFALPLTQLIPLPPVIWHNLPGNDLRTDILRLVGEEDNWLPISIAPQATARWAIAALVPLATFMATLTLREKGRLRVGMLIVALALISALLGFVQFSSEGALGTIYDTIYTGDAVGFFTNRNHFAALAYVAIPLICVICRRSFNRNVARGAILPCLLAILLFSALVSASRAGLLLSLLAVPFGLLCSADRPARYLAKRTMSLTAGVVVASAIIFVILMASNNVVSTIVGRFQTLILDYRTTIWSNSWPLIWENLPFGSGMGTFVQVYAASEPFNALIEKFVNHAHHDYLEMSIEGGVLGVALMLVMLAVFGGAARRLVVAENPDIVARAAACSLSLLLLHSLVDYPLRTFCLLAIAGVLAGLMMQQAAGETVRHRTKALPDAGLKPERK